jgi:hypothetical protein
VFSKCSHGSPSILVMSGPQADLPGYELVSAGLDDLAAGRESESALLVAMAAPRLRAIGIDVPQGGERSHPIVSMNCSPRPMRGLTVATTRLSLVW